MHLTSYYVNASYNQAYFWIICKQKDLSIYLQGHHVHQRKKHIIWMSQCSHALYCLNAGRSLVSICATLRNPWENTGFSLLWTHFCHYCLILSLLLIMVRTFGTHRVREDDVLLEKRVLPCHISAPERSNTNMQSNQRQTVPASIESFVVTQQLNYWVFSAQNNDPICYNIIIWMFSSPFAVSGKMLRKEK